VTYKLILGDCLSVMPTLGEKSINSIITDLPYGTIAAKWDVIIPFDEMWKEVKRILKPKGAFITTASQPFASKLIMSNLKDFKYEWILVKTKPNGWQHAKNKPMSAHENILVFSESGMGHESLLGNNRMNYYPQGVTKGGEKIVSDKWHGRSMGARPNQVGKKYVSQTGYPNSVLFYPNVSGKNAMHPTQKSVDLYKYLIETYTCEGDTVLDICTGSATTLEAAERTGRNSIGIEKDPDIFDVAVERMRKYDELMTSRLL